MARQRLSGKQNLDPEILSLYNRLAAELGKSYQAYTVGISRFLDILEENNQYAIPYGIEVFMDQCALNILIFYVCYNWDGKDFKTR